VGGIVLSRPDGHVPYGIAIPGHGFDTLFVLSDHDLCSDIHILQLEVVQEYFKRGPPFSLVHDGNRRVRASNCLPIGDLACVDRNNLLVGEGLHRIFMMENGADAIAGDGECGEIPFVLLHRPRDHADVGETVAAGKAHQEILRAATEQRSDLIVLGVPGHHLAGFGSTTTHIVREAECPVLTVRG